MWFPTGNQTGGNRRCRNGRGRHRRRGSYAHRKALGRVGRLHGHGPGRFRHRRGPLPGRRVPRPGRLRADGPGHPGRAGPDHGPPGRGEGRDPDDGSGQHHQQGLPLGSQHDLPGRPDDPGRRRRDRRGRRHGVDDAGPPPSAGRPCRVPDRGRHAGRLHDVRRPHRLLRPHRHGPLDRAAQRQGRDLARAAGRVLGGEPREGRRRSEGRTSGRGDRRGAGAPTEG